MSWFRETYLSIFEVDLRCFVDGNGMQAALKVVWLPGESKKDLLSRTKVFEQEVAMLKTASANEGSKYVMGLYDHAVVETPANEVLTGAPSSEKGVGNWTTGHTGLMVTQFMSNGDMFDWWVALEEGGKFGEDKVVNEKIVKYLQLVRGVEHIHELGIV